MLSLCSCQSPSVGHCPSLLESVNTYKYAFLRESPSFLSGEWAETKKARRSAPMDRPPAEAAGAYQGGGLGTRPGRGFDTCGGERGILRRPEQCQTPRKDLTETERCSGRAGVASLRLPPIGPPYRLGIHQADGFPGTVRATSADRHSSRRGGSARLHQGARIGYYRHTCHVCSEMVCYFGVGPSTP